MATWHGFGTEKEQYRKLVEFMKGPSSFFEKNKDDHDAIVDFYTFTMRVTMAITLFMTAFTIVMIPFFAVIIVLARFITRF